MQVFLDDGLPGVLAAAANNNIDVLGEFVAGVVVDNVNVEPVGVCTACE